MRFTTADLLLILAIHGYCLYRGCCSAARVIQSYHFGASGTGGSLSSPAFPEPYPRNKTIYEYHLRNTDPSGFVQIVFTDFLLNEGSILYIHDFEEESSGVNYTGAAFIRGDIPVYQSKSSRLRVVFKTGSGTQSSADRGFKATYNFVKYTREDWINRGIPRVGLCGDITKSGSDSGTSVTAWRGAEKSVYISCRWFLPLNTNNLIIQLPEEQGNISIVVREGPTSADPEVDPTGTVSGRGGNTLTFSGSGIHRISASGYLKQDQLILFAFSAQERKTLELLRESRPKKNNSPCAFKKCPGTDDCLLYWESCQDPYKTADSTCDISEGRKLCASGRRCFNVVTDSCDDYHDCQDASDEENCGRPIGVTVAVASVLSFLLLILILTIIMCLLLRNRKKKELHKQERCAQLTNVFSKGLCCSNIDKPSTSGSHSNIVNSPSGSSSRDGGMLNGGLQCSNMSLPLSKANSGVYTISNGLSHHSANGKPPQGVTRDKDGGFLNPLDLQLSSRASSVESLAKEDPDGPPNFDWLTFAPAKKKKSSRRRRQKPPQSLILPRPVSFPSSIVVTSPSPEGNRQSNVFVIESPPSCEEVASFMSGTGLEPLSPMEQRPRAYSLQPTASNILQTDL